MRPVSCRIALQPVAGAVDVADGDHAAGIGLGRGRGGGRAGGEQCREGRARDAAEAHTPVSGRGGRRRGSVDGLHLASSVQRWVSLRAATARAPAR